MNEPKWVLAKISPTATDKVVWRVFADGRQESRFVSSFTSEDPDYQNIMKLVEEGKLVIQPAEEDNV